MEGGLGLVKSNVDMEYGLSSKPNEPSFLPTIVSPSITFASVSSEVGTLVHSERAPASTSVSSFSTPWEHTTSQKTDMTAVISVCPFCNGTGGLPFPHMHAISIVVSSYLFKSLRTKCLLSKN